ncbi:hypothetical protein M409DRAFT_24798 [Zasmidium cellare ATCC 36951]|uniref:Heterokaryon incompatibility domain-containing protein n=1 Tax=Zasmidium cellare ATCC 36951 TaxID=1080233 RepID=A0A6A6CCI1_ZASCE|nr:uncharacterized protein M409DRAFT_24798 [Zasmidium cellare ATCC 36951]KAF2164894.1 hypothetical protein M409DRAFT_24798 [Zasmidium cellare ATCC 36951]
MNDSLDHESTNECPNIKDRVRQAYSEAGVKTWQAIGRTQTSKNHETCSIARCVANDIAHTDERPWHTQADCTCECDGPESGELLSLIEQGCLPVVGFDDQDIVLDAWTPNIPIIAISHALSDGLCNRRENKLPKCQLRSLRDCTTAAISRLGYPEGSPFRVWIDVLCIPAREVQPSGTSEVAVQAMQMVANAAAAVLVVDSDVSRLPKDCSYEQAIFSILYSSWNSRLWTLYEAIRAKRLLFQFANGVLDLDDIESKRGDVVNGPSNHSALSLPFRELHSRLCNGPTNLADIWPSVYASLRGRRTNFLKDACVIFRMLFGTSSGQAYPEIVNTPDALSDEQMMAFCQQLIQQFQSQDHNTNPTI